MSSALRVAFISEHASPLAVIGGVDAGGQNIVVAELATALGRMGVDVDVFTRQSGAEQPLIVDWKPGVRVIHIPAGPRQFIAKEKLLPLMGEFADNLLQFIQLQRKPYHLVHAHFFMSGLVAYRLKQQLGVPYVVTFHALGEVRRRCQGSSDGFPASRPKLEKRVMQGADRIVALCPQDRTDLMTLYGADPAAITVIPNGYAPADFFPVPAALARTQLGLAADEPIILQLGRMVPRKGVDNVIRAMGDLTTRHGLKAQLLVVGGESVIPDPLLTPEIGRLQGIADQLGIADRVTFTGSRSQQQLHYYYSAADVFVTTPWYEPFGITPLEAMGCGTPVIGAAVGGIQHTVLHGETGLLVPPNEPALLANCLHELLSQAHLRQKMGRAALRHVKAQYTWTQVARQTLHLYDGIGASRRRTGVMTRPGAQPAVRL